MFSAPRQMFSGLNYKQSAARHGSKSSNGMVTADTKWDRWFHKRRPSLRRAMVQTLGFVCPLHTGALLLMQLSIKMKKGKEIKLKNTKLETLYFETFFLKKHGPNKQASGERDEGNVQELDFPSCSEIRNPVFCTSQSGC